MRWLTRPPAAPPQGSNHHRNGAREERTHSRLRPCGCRAPARAGRRGGPGALLCGPAPLLRPPRRSPSPRPPPASGLGTTGQRLQKLGLVIKQVRQRQGGMASLPFEVWCMCCAAHRVDGNDHRISIKAQLLICAPLGLGEMVAEADSSHLNGPSLAPFPQITECQRPTTTAVTGVNTALRMFTFIFPSLSSAVPLTAGCVSLKTKASDPCQVAELVTQTLKCS